MALYRLKVDKKGEQALPFSILDNDLEQYLIRFYQRFLPFFEEEILNGQHFASLNAAEKEDLAEQLREFFQLLDQQIHVNYAFNRLEGIEQLQDKKNKVSTFLLKFPLEREKSEEKQNFSEEPHGQSLYSLSVLNRLQLRLREIFYSFMNKLKKDAPQNIKRTIAVENGLRLYWVWSSSFLSSIFMLLKLDIARNRLAIQAPLMGFLSVVPYFFRGFLELGWLLKHTLATRFLSAEEKQLSLSARFHYQWSYRDDIILNDLPWASANLICWIGLFGVAGTGLNLVLFVSDFFLSLRRFKKKEAKYCAIKTKLNNSLVEVETSIAQSMQDLANREDLLRKKLFELRHLILPFEQDLRENIDGNVNQSLLLRNKNSLLQESDWKKLQESVLDLKRMIERAGLHEHCSEKIPEHAKLQAIKEKTEEFSQLIDAFSEEKIKHDTLAMKKIRRDQMKENLMLRWKFQEKVLKLDSFYGLSLVVGFAAVGFVSIPLVLAIAGAISFLSMVGVTVYRHYIRLERAKSFEALKVEEEKILSEAGAPYLGISEGEPLKGGLHAKTVKNYATLFSTPMLHHKKEQVQRERAYYHEKTIFIKKNLYREMLSDLIYPCLIAGVLMAAPSLGLSFAGILAVSIVGLAAKLWVNRYRPNKDNFFRKTNDIKALDFAPTKNLELTSTKKALDHNSAEAFDFGATKKVLDFNPAKALDFGSRKKVLDFNSAKALDFGATKKVLDLASNESFLKQERKPLGRQNSSKI